MKNTNKAVKPASKPVSKPLGLEVKGATAKPEKDLLKAKLVAFLNAFSYVTTWDKKHEAKFIDVLEGGLVSSQITELSSLGYFLKRKHIVMLNVDGKIFDFEPIFKMSDTLKDEKIVKAEKLNFSKAKIGFHTKFLASYGLVFASIARGVKDYNGVDGIQGDEGKQVLSFISLLVKLGYKFK